MTIGRLLLIVTAWFLPACSLFPWYASVNAPARQKETRASQNIGDAATRDGMFIGVALSGGGSRAANFGAGVMFELDRLRILERADFISSVSGGSIAAAYYALHGYPADGPPKISFDRRRIDELFARDFQWRWIGRWFDPWNVARYWTTAFDRSDIMYQVFEANLFHKATFAHLSKTQPSSPSVLINATNFTTGRKFTFSNEAFERRGSDLAGYPIARAVMASGAFPGAFANVTLLDYESTEKRKRDQYVHLFDGGPIDNLGVGTLVKTLQRHVEPYWNTAADPLRESGFPRGCLIISIDAFTDRVDPDPRKGEVGSADLADTRPWYGFIVDTNAIEAMDSLLAVKRNEVLHEMGLDRENDDLFGSFPLFGLNLDDDEEGVPTLRLLEKLKADRALGPSMPEQSERRAALTRAAYCHVWHIGIAQMPTKDCPLGRRVNRIGTWYRINKEDQCGLFEAARTLVRTMWANPDLQRWVQEGLPTYEPIPGAPLTMPDKHRALDCREPEIDVQDGAEICRITLSPE
jgi:predicted acylesterase/phospholipase RssA